MSKSRSEKMWAIVSDYGPYYSCFAPTRIEAIHRYLKHDILFNEDPLSCDEKKKWSKEKRKGNRAVKVNVKWEEK